MWETMLCKKKGRNCRKLFADLCCLDRMPSPVFKTLLALTSDPTEPHICFPKLKIEKR